MAEKQIDPAPLVRRGRSPGAGWSRVARGLHRSGGLGLLGDLHAWSAVLRPTAAFTHLTAAQVRGWWLPPLPEDLPVWVTQTMAQNASTRSGLVVIRRRGIPWYDHVGGLRVSTAAETLVTCAIDLGLLDLVVLIDAALHQGDVTIAELEEVARQHRRGAPRLREAMPYVEGRSESAWETLLRVLHVICGIEVEPQKELFTADGSFVARADLWLVGTERFHEYDGDDHLERRRRRKDLKRDGRIGRADLERRGYTSADVLTQGVSILRDADEAIGREHDLARIRPWNDLLRESLFTPSGRRGSADGSGSRGRRSRQQMTWAPDGRPGHRPTHLFFPPPASHRQQPHRQRPADSQNP
ncbi:hypothetical protein SAMN04487968_101554 [Nocardioides terrae]|uniref:Transcriptional regulator, AbiEi antitoxin, Type IV TA system n=2 Tax=Nocardioides terrae TaxID=574651 RepID=A0A1I1DX53_9ACTN|nr:hypothetical protein SAMN04487968_101554 [Nocardioides terrae]